MHFELKRVGRRPPYCPRVWWFRYGFGLWLFRVIVTAGHDVRSRMQASAAVPPRERLRVVR